MKSKHIKVFPLNQSQYLMNITIQYECATDQPFKIIQYRYGGFGWRTTEEWDNQNSRVLSSEGITRKNADGSTARWCIVDGKLNDGHGGALMLSHPENYNHPEPLRVWPEDQYGEETSLSISPLLKRRIGHLNQEKHMLLNTN